MVHFTYVPSALAAKHCAAVAKLMLPLRPPAAIIMRYLVRLFSKVYELLLLPQMLSHTAKLGLSFDHDQCSYPLRWFGPHCRRHVAFQRRRTRSLCMPPSSKAFGIAIPAALLLMIPAETGQTAWSNAKWLADGMQIGGVAVVAAGYAMVINMMKEAVKYGHSCHWLRSLAAVSHWPDRSWSNRCCSP